jgi:hypothetical protein
VREDVLSAEGGAVTAETLGEQLGSTPHAVEAQRRGGSLLAVYERGAWRYPAWQLSDGKLLDGLGAVLQVLAQHALSPWDTMIFFLHTDTEREGESPLQALRAGRRDAALRAARMYGEHGAR